jgi:hypothetical protein
MQLEGELPDLMLFIVVETPTFELPAFRLVIPSATDTTG